MEGEVRPKLEIEVEALKRDVENLRKSLQVVQDIAILNQRHNSRRLSYVLKTIHTKFRAIENKTPDLDKLSLECEYIKIKEDNDKEKKQIESSPIAQRLKELCLPNDVDW